MQGKNNRCSLCHGTILYLVLSVAMLVLSGAGGLWADNLTISSGQSETIAAVGAHSYDTITVNGSLTISGAGVAVTAATVLVAEGTGETGQLTVTDGASLTITGARSGTYYPFSISHPTSASGSGESSGTVNVLNGATVTVEDMVVANMESCQNNSARAALNITNATVTVKNNFWTTRGYNYAGYDGSWYPAHISLGANATLNVKAYTRNGGSKTRFLFGGGQFRFMQMSSLDGGTIVMEGDGSPINLDVNNSLATWATSFVDWMPFIKLQTGGRAQFVGNGGLTLNSVLSLETSTLADSSSSHRHISASYTGPITLNLPGLRQMARGQVCSGANTLVLASAQGASFDLNGFDTEFPAIDGTAGCVCNTAATAATLTVGAGDTDRASLALAGPIAVRKVGSGAWTVTADDLAGVSVDAGTLNLLAPASTGYRFWQFHPTATYGANATHIQLSEFDFLNAEGIRQLDMTKTEGTMPTTSLNNLFDQNAGTKACEAVNADGYTITAVFGLPHIVTQYRWMTADDYGAESKYGGRPDKTDLLPPSYNVTQCRDPKDWTVRASNDGMNWKTMDTVSGFKADNNRKTYNTTNFVCTYSERLLTGPVAVASGATLNVDSGELAFTSWAVKGTVNMADGVRYVLGGAVDELTFDLPQACAIEKTDANRYQVIGGTVTGGIHVAEGTLALGGHNGISQKYWRWRIKKLKAWWTDPAKYVDRAQTPVAFQMCELGLFDRSGRRVNLLSDGTTVVARDNSEFNKLLDGDMTGNCFMFITGNGSNSIPMPDPSDESTWSGFAFKLPDGAEPVFTYQFATASDHTDRDPVSWDFAVSDNGSDWTIIEDRAEETVGIERVSWTAYNGGEPFLFKIPSDPSGIVAGTEVQVDRGATLELPGTATVIDTLTIDWSQGGGTITHFNPAACGTLNLVNVPVGVDVTANPLLTVGTVVNIFNLSRWTVTVNGTSRGYSLTMRDGALLLSRRGIRLIIR